MSTPRRKSPSAGNLSPEFALLGFLLAGPQHGYDLHRRFTSELGQVWHLSQSQAYAILKRLEARGAVSSHLIAQEKLPPRQVLRITAGGRRLFADWLESGVSTNARGIRLEFLTRLYFARLYQPDKSREIYERQRTAVDTCIQRLEQALAGLPPEQLFNRLSLDLRLRQMRLIGVWLQEIGAQLLSPEASQ